LRLKDMLLLRIDSLLTIGLKIIENM